MIIGEHGGVKTGQRQRRGRVGERGTGPIGGGMANGTVLRESGGLVRRSGGSVVIGLVAIPAGRAGQAEVIIHVALGARCRKMRPGQGEARGGVVERGAGPIGGGMAAGTILRESAGFVRRVGGVVVVGLVTVPAGGAGQAVIIVHVAQGALQAGMRAG